MQRRVQGQQASAQAAKGKKGDFIAACRALPPGTPTPIAGAAPASPAARSASRSDLGRWNLQDRGQCTGRVGQHEVEGLPLRRIEHVWAHEGGRLHVRERCNGRGRSGTAGSRALRSRAAPVCLGPARLPVVSTEGLAIVRRQASASSSAGAGPPPAPLAGSSSHRRKAASWGTCSRRTPAPACFWLSPTAVAPV